MTGSRQGGGGGQQNQRWLAVPSSPAQAELRRALDQAAARDADEVALRRVWARLAEMPDKIGSSGQLRDGSQYPVGDQIGAGSGIRRNDRSRRPWIVAASLAGATATLAFMLFETKSEMRSARVEKTTPLGAGSVAGKIGDQRSDQRSVLVAPATVRTAIGETLHLSLRGGTDVVVTSESTLVLDENDRPSVSAGEVQFRVPPQTTGRVFTVTAGAYRIVVVGTRFRVNVQPANAAVNVDEGVVEIWTDRRIARIAAGESWASSVAPAAAPAPIVNPPSKPVRSARSARASRRHILALSSPSSGGASAFQASSASSFPPIASAGPVSALGPSVGSAAAGTGVTATADPGPSIAPPPAAPVATPTTVPVPAPVDAAVLAAQARIARAAGDSRRALGLYRALAQKGGTAGENAEYEIGRVLRDGLRQPREAVSAWRAYRAQHPRGLLRIEADISVIETLVSIGDKAGAAGEASDFIRRYPESERRMEIARMAGDLLRERGDCLSAIDAYNIAVAGGRGRRDVTRSAADSVSFHRSACLLRGDKTEGVRALKSYLQSFPAGRHRAEAQRLLGGTQSSAAVSRP